MSLIYTTLASDTFQRPDEEPLNPADWTVSSGENTPLAVVNHQCVSDASLFGQEYYSGVSLPDNQWCEVTIGVGLFSLVSASEITPGIRDDGSGLNLYYIDLYQTSADLVRIVGGTPTVIAPLGITPAIGDTWRLGAFGSTLYVFQNDTQVASVIDTTFTSGFASVFISANLIQTDTSITAFRAGSITQSGGGAGSSGSWLTVANANALRGSRSH